jgi:hypothetical protein
MLPVRRRIFVRRRIHLRRRIHVSDGSRQR